MSFSLIRPSGFAFGSKLTSLEMSQLDADHAKALDKSVANDNIEGTIGFVGSGKISANLAGSIVANASNAIQAGVAGGIQSNVANGIVVGVAAGLVASAAGAIVAGIAAGITDGGIAEGIQATVTAGIVSNASEGIVPLVADGISTSVAGGISSTVAGGIVSRTAGGIKLSGGGSDWIAYNTTRSITRTIPIGFFASGWTGWSMGFGTGPALVGSGVTNEIVVPLTHLLSGDLNGATLTSVSLAFAVHSGHGAVPTMGGMDLRRQAIAGNSSLGGQSLYSGGFQTIPTPGSVAIWENSGVSKVFSTTPNQFNQLDLTGFVYYLQIQDESGGNAVAGNQYLALTLDFGAITNSAPG